MRATVLRTSLFAFAALTAAFVFSWNPAPASSAVMTETGSNTRLVVQEGYSPEGVILAKGQRKRIDDSPGVPRNRGRLGHPQPHRVFDDGSDDDFLAKRRGRVDDNPKRHIGPHKLMEDSATSGSLYSQARRRFDDNPTGPRRDDNPRRRFGPHKLIDDTNDAVIAARGRVDDSPKRHPRRGHA